MYLVSNIQKTPDHMFTISISETRTKRREQSVVCLLRIEAERFVPVGNITKPAKTCPTINLRINHITVLRALFSSYHEDFIGTIGILIL